MDLSTLSDDELRAYEVAAISEFDEISNGEQLSTEALARAAALADNIEAARTESARRADQSAANSGMRDTLRTRIHGEAPVDNDGFSNVDGDVTAGAHYTPATTQPREHVSPGKTRQLNLGMIQEAAPKVNAPERRTDAELVAAANVPGAVQGSRFENVNDLIAAMTARVRTVPVTQLGADAPTYAVAQLNRTFKHTLDIQSTPDEVDAVLQAATNVDELVAAGGWCSPSEISYDLFNIVCNDGTLDLPTVGINRGGIRFPISPDFSSLAGNTALWSWNETQDIAAVTGTAQSGTKTCGRVPCVSFAEERLHCDGVCLTVGNLMDDSYPELIQNHVRLLMAMNYHKMNLLRINSLTAASVLVSGTAGQGAVDESVVNNVLGVLELQAMDYRAKFAMCIDAVLEVVLPRWLLAVMRSDLRRRTGIELISVQNAYLMRLFDAMNIRIQWVGDWQERTTGYPGAAGFLTWPTQVQALMFAPGTFVLGNGLQLNLGVIRDSVLNQTNDFTAMWAEECWLVAKLGHESRRIVINICPNGRTGAANITACGL